MRSWRRRGGGFTLLLLVACSAEVAPMTVTGERPRADGGGDAPSDDAPHGVRPGLHGQQTPAPDPVQSCPPSRTCDFPMLLGVGTEFEEVVPEQTVTVFIGPQGGFHVWLALRCSDCADQVLVEYGTRDPEDDTWLWGQPLRGVANLDTVGVWNERAGLFGLLPGSPSDTDYVGTRVALEITVEDGERQSSRVVPVTIDEVVEWDCPSGDPDAC